MSDHQSGSDLGWIVRPLFSEPMPCQYFQTPKTGDIHPDSKWFENLKALLIEPLGSGVQVFHFPFVNWKRGYRGIIKKIIWRVFKSFSGDNTPSFSILRFLAEGFERTYQNSKRSTKSFCPGTPYWSRRFISPNSIITISFIDELGITIH